MTTPRVVHCKVAPAGSFAYIGRPSEWGNPFTVGYDAESGTNYTREEAVDLFRAMITSRPEAIERARRLLRGKDLGCWCKSRWQPNRLCHGDVLLEIANSDD